MAPSTVLDVDPATFYAAAGQCVSACNVIADGLIALGQSLSISGSMAGSDDGGREWGTDYGTGTANLFEVANQLTAAVGNYADLLSQGGTNHAQGESDASIASTSPASAPRLPHMRVVNIAPPPSSIGDSGPGLQGAIDLAAAVGVPCPNGNTDQLDATSRAWLAFGQEAEEARRQLLTAPADMFGSVQSPDIGDIYRELRQLADICQSLFSSSSDMATSCRSHSSNLQSTRSEIVDAIEQFAIEEAAAIAIGIGLSFLAAGVSAAAGAAITAGRFVSTAHKVQSIIGGLRTALGMSRLGGTDGDSEACSRRTGGDRIPTCCRPARYPPTGKSEATFTLHCRRRSGLPAISDTQRA